MDCCRSQIQCRTTNRCYLYSMTAMTHRVFTAILWTTLDHFELSCMLVEGSRMPCQWCQGQELLSERLGKDEQNRVERHTGAYSVHCQDLVTGPQHSTVSTVSTSCVNMFQPSWRELKMRCESDHLETFLRWAFWLIFITFHHYGL